MKIAGIMAVFPSRIVTNEEVVDLLKTESKKQHNFTLKNPKSIVDQLDAIELRTRRWIDHGESRMDLIALAVEKSLKQAGLQKKEIDLIIYSSVDKQFKEPGDSFFIAKTLGFKNVECFDILEACNSFIRASNIAQVYLQTGQYQNIMVITAEFMAHGKDGLPSYGIKTIKDLDYSFSSLTIGEGTTAIIFSNSNQSWNQKIVGLPQYSNFCYMLSASDITEADKLKFEIKEQDIVPNQFVSYGLKMHKNGYQETKEMIFNLLETEDFPAIVFPHTHSKIVWDKFSEKLGKDIPYYHIFPEYGNLVSSSLPAGIYLAVKEGKLKRKMKASAWMTAAGMSLSVTNFEY